MASTDDLSMDPTAGIEALLVISTPSFPPFPTPHLAHPSIASPCFTINPFLSLSSLCLNPSLLPRPSSPRSPSFLPLS